MSLPEQLMKKWAGGLSTAGWRLFGEDCLLCGAVKRSADMVCGACTTALARPGRGAVSQGVVASFEYRFPVNRLVQRFKFHGDLALGKWLGRSLCDALLHAGAAADLICVPPLAPSRLRERGFNQAAELAKVVGSGLGVPLSLAGVCRVREAASQLRLGARARHANLLGAFECRAAVDGLHVAVVDDVYTTGATTAEMARALRYAGAARVSSWVVARTP